MPSSSPKDGVVAAAAAAAAAVVKKKKYKKPSKRAYLSVSENDDNDNDNDSNNNGAAIMENEPQQQQQQQRGGGEKDGLFRGTARPPRRGGRRKNHRGGPNHDVDDDDDKELHEGLVSSSSAAAAAAANANGDGDDGDHSRKKQLVSEKDQQQQLITQANGASSPEEEAVALITIEHAMELVGMGKFQYWILTAAGLCFCADAMQVILLSFLSPVLEREWELAAEEAAAITSILFAGAMLGTLVLGPAADVLGRRPIFLLAAAIISAAGLLTAAAPNYCVALATIFLSGFGVGGLTVPFDILAEFLPADHRGTNLLKIEYFWTVGCLFVVLIARFTLSGGGDATAHWRTFVALNTVPCVLSLAVGYCFVPESPAWLAAKGRTDEALAILRTAAIGNGHEPAELFSDATALAPEPEEKHASVRDLFTPAWREITVRLWGLWASFAFGYYGAIMAVTRVFDNDESGGSSADTGGYNSTLDDATTALAAGAPASSDAASAGGQYNFDYFAIFFSSAAELLGTTAVIWTVDEWGRIPLQIISYAMGGVSIFLLCMTAAWHQEAADAEDDSFGRVRWLLMLGFGFVARTFEMSGSCVSWVSTAEILTTEVRSTGHATANAVARLAGFFSPLVVEGTTPIRQVGIVMLAVHACAVLFVCKLPETAGKEMGATTTATATATAVSPIATDEEDEEAAAMTAATTTTTMTEERRQIHRHDNDDDDNNNKNGDDDDEKTQHQQQHHLVEVTAAEAEADQAAGGEAVVRRIPPID